VKAAVARVVVFLLAVRAHGKDAHGRVGPVVGNVGDDGKARAAVGAVDERIAIATIAGVEQLSQAVRADGDVGRDGLKLARLGLRVADGEPIRVGKLHIARRDPADGHLLDAGQRGSFRLKERGELVQNLAGADGLDLDAGGAIEYPADKLQAHGKVVNEGDPDSVISSYLTVLRGANSRSAHIPTSCRLEDNSTKIVGVGFRNRLQRSTQVLYSGETVQFVVKYRSNQIGKTPIAAVSCFAITGEKLFHLDSSEAPACIDPLTKTGELVATIDHLPLTNGDYKVDARITVDAEVQDHCQDAAFFTVEGGDFYRTGRAPLKRDCLMFLNHRWNSV